jgi:hypothetical protein
MEDAIPDSRDHRNGGEGNEGMRHRYRGEGTADDEEPTDQDWPSTEAIDCEARSGLTEA